MNTLEDLYTFIDLAKANRKYPESTANNLKSALKIFEKNLNAGEIKSLHLIETNIDGIFRTVVINNKDKSIGSLNTYKARLIRVINDFKRYGTDPSKLQNWVVKKNSTPLSVKKDKQDKEKIILSDSHHTPVHKIELALNKDSIATIIVPKGINREDIKAIKSVLDSLVSGK
jgi:hypothetical protein